MQNKRCRSERPLQICPTPGSQEPLTGEQKAEYIKRMGDIRQRLLEIRSQLDSEITHSIQTTVKVVYLYFREIAEMLIDCLVITRITQGHNIDLS